MFLDRLNAFVGVGLCRVALTGDDDLAVRGFQVEVVLAGLVGKDFEFRSHALTIDRPGASRVSGADSPEMERKKTEEEAKNRDPSAQHYGNCLGRPINPHAAC